MRVTRRPQVDDTVRRGEFPRPTPAGILFAASVAVTAMVALQPSANLLIIVLGMFVGALAVNFGAGWWSLRRLTVQRVLSDSVSAGAPHVIKYRLRNDRRFSGVYGLRLRDFVTSSATGRTYVVESFVPALPAGGDIVISTPVVWPQRGRLRFDPLIVETRFPFGFFLKRLTLSMRGETIVFPALGVLRRAVWDASRGIETSGEGDGHATRPGGDEVFHGLRPYRPGDNPKRIHWRRSARTGQIYVREMARPRLRQLWCVLNTHLPQPNDVMQDRLETVISCVATVVCDVLERGGKIGLIVNGEPVLVSPPGSGRELRGRLLRELAQRAANTTDPLDVCLGRMNWPSRWRGSCLLFTSVLDPAVTRASNWLTAHVGPVSLLMPGAGAFDSLYAPRAQMASPTARVMAAVAAMGNAA
ncbi:MAG: DUF58 domain-containing protein [Phycisphaerae bacterium]|nr:DUF58 domain-containing protein [Phycisphaerae bacterium]